MRIISGTAKGTKLYTLDGIETRPTLDRVKESLFNIIKDEIDESSVLDLFSGSGAVGLEFASRGAKEVYLCDKSKKACTIIERNVEKTHLQNKIYIYNMDFISLIENIKGKVFDIVFLDPPYKTDFIEQALVKLIECGCIEKKTLIIAETDEEERIIKQIENINVRIIDKRKYGRANLLFLRN